MHIYRGVQLTMVRFQIVIKCDMVDILQ